MKQSTVHSPRSRKAFHFAVPALSGFLLLSVPFQSGCTDPREAPSLAPDPGHTRTLTLALDEVSNGTPVEMTFEVEKELASITQPGQDTPARLFLTAFIRPDAEILQRESIIDNLIPDLSDEITRYRVGLEETAGAVEDLTALIDSCEAHPGECPQDSLNGLIAALVEAEADFDLYEDSLEVAVADTTALGVTRDSLGIILDDRYTLSIQIDADEMVAYPEAVYVDTILTLSGQGIYLAQTGPNDLKGRTFTLDLARFDAADLNNIGRTIELNWTTCFPGSDRPCLSVGTHRFRVTVNGPETWITATLVLVYAEEI